MYWLDKGCKLNIFYNTSDWSFSTTTRTSGSLQGSKGILDHGNSTQANVISILDLFNVSLSRTWYCFDAFMELVGLTSLFLFLCFELLKSH